MLVDVVAAVLDRFSFLVLAVLMSGDAAADRTQYTVMSHVAGDRPRNSARKATDRHGGRVEPNRSAQRQQPGNRNAHLHHVISRSRSTRRLNA
jgi:hypothetical protein